MNRIKEVLEERGIKQTWLAEKLGKSFCMVNSYVCNRRQPSLEVLFEIAKILNVDPKDLNAKNIVSLQIEIIYSIWRLRNRNYIVPYGNAATSFVVVWMQANTKIMCWLYSS